MLLPKLAIRLSLQQIQQRQRLFSVLLQRLVETSIVLSMLALA
jgi:hypothetical protein